MSDALAGPPRTTLQRRTVTTLVVSQALGGVGVSTGVAVASLLAVAIIDNETLAGLPQTAQVVGSAVLAYLTARVMNQRGRRLGLALGYGAGAVGAGLCVLSAVVDSFVLLLVGAFFLGSATAANNQARYAATDLAEPHTRARSLSIVVWATTIGAVLGPNLIGPSGDVAAVLGMPELAGGFLLGVAGLALSVLVIWVWLRPDPLLVARSLAGVPDTDRPRHTSLRRALAVTREHPTAAWAMAAMALAHTVMVAVMVMTPLHMQHGGAGLSVIGFVISMHVLGMFAFAPVVGWLSDRVGRSLVLGVGGCVLLASVFLAGRTDAGHSSALTWGLFLLGLGWSCALIASSALLVDHIPLVDRPGVQGASDLVMGLAAAGGGALAGVVVGQWGYGLLNAAAAVVAVGVLITAFGTKATASEESPVS